MTESTDQDLLSRILISWGLQASVFARPRVCGAWQINTSGDDVAGYHLLAQGRCWLHMRHLSQPVELGAGDVLLLPRNQWHVLSAEPHIEDDTMRLIDDGSGPYSALVCGRVEFEAGSGGPLLQCLPDHVLIRSAAGGARLGQLVRLVAEEAESDTAGTDAVLNALSNALVVMLLRHHALQSDASSSGLLAAITDPRLAPVLAAVHADPGHGWTIPAMAELALLSRSALIERFQRVLGIAPIAYLTRLRMEEARKMLTEPGSSVGQVAARLGYESEAAFRRAFRRECGIAPGAVRRAARSLGAAKAENDQV